MAKHIKKECIKILKTIVTYDCPHKAELLYTDMVDQCVLKGISSEDIVQKDYFYKSWLPKEDWLEIYYDPYLQASYYRRIDDPAKDNKRSWIGQIVDRGVKCVIGGRGICRK